MMTMYEKLMMLPIFKGMNPEQMSVFLEKTHLEFNTHETGSVIVSRGGECDRLYCILSGRVQCIYPLSGNNVRLAAEYGSGKVIGLDRLYGMDTRYGVVVKALEECGTMSFGKSQYMSLIQSNQICTINYLNMLSYRCQRAVQAMERLLPASLTGQLAMAVAILTDRDSQRILVQDAERLMEGDCHAELDSLIGAGLMRRISEHMVEIPSRTAFLDHAEVLSQSEPE